MAHDNDNGDDRQLELTRRRAEIAGRYLLPRNDRPATTARGVHHVALICSDVERTVQFFDGLLGFPLIEMFENRDYAGSTHFFFDLGHGNTLAYFDLPGLDLGPYAEVLGGHGRPGPQGLRRLPVAAAGRAAHLGAKREVGDGHVVDQDAELCGALGQLATHGCRDLHVHGSRQVG